MIKKTIKHGIGVIGTAIMFFVFDLNCLFKTIFGFHCPTCGLTRALISLFKFDIKGYIYYNAMAVFIVLSIVIIVHQSTAKVRNKKLEIIAMTLVVINFIYYLFRLLNNLIP